ncbi:MAG: class I SAM-dependent methyltransferase [Candidatus Nealsonbacteria bacterium]|nr:class I SAM-dependent methyltransferase [Candidatus Nealsonbacteria bacterium]
MEKDKESNFDEASLQLFKDLEEKNKRIKDFLIDNYRGLPSDPQVEEEAHEYFINNSVFFSAMAAQNASSMVTEFLYERLPSQSILDSYALKSKAGSAIKARLDAVEDELHKVIEEYSPKGEVLIGNFGSGPGRDVVDVLSKYYQNFSNIRAINVDRDVTALKRGKRIASIKKVDHLIDFVEGSFLKYEPEKKFDIVILVGILCALQSEVCVNILQTARGLLKEGGCIIASNVTDKMKEEDPFACYIMNWVANWDFVYKNEEKLKKIFDQAGYLWKKGFTDSYGFHFMGIGTPKP